VYELGKAVKHICRTILRLQQPYTGWPKEVSRCRESLNCMKNRQGNYIFTKFQ